VVVRGDRCGACHQVVYRGCGAVASYEHGYALVRAHGGGEWTGRLVPPTVDGADLREFDGGAGLGAPQGSRFGAGSEADGTEGADTDDYAGRRVDDGLEGTETRAQGYDTSGPTTDDAMTRSEERLRVGTENVPTGQARLRKYVVTENVSTTVPVSHEEVRLEREPITEANRDAALSGADITEEEHELTLHAERPVVAKETVPVERVRLSTETVTEEQQVNEQVRKEQIDEPDVDSGVTGTER
jgi:uncharacterized protein (TIGR02271 family)